MIDIPEVLKIVLFGRDFNSLSKEDKLEAIRFAKGSNKEEIYIHKLEHNYSAIKRIKQENEALDKLALEAWHDKRFRWKAKRYI